MAVAFSAFPVTVPYYELITSSPYDTNLYLPTGTNRALLVAITTLDAIDYSTTASVVVNPFSLAETCTLLGYQVDPTVNRGIALYGLLLSSSGTVPLRITGIPDYANGVVSAILFTGVKQTSIATAFTNLVLPKDLGFSSPSVTVSSAVGNMVATAFNAATYATSVDGNQWWKDGVSSGGSYIDGAASVTRSCFLNSASQWVGIGINIVQDAVVLTANNLAVGVKTFSQPTLGIKRVFVANSLAVGAKTFGQPVLAQKQVLDPATPLNVSPLALAAGVLTQKHALALPIGVAIPALALGAPAVTVSRTLVATSAAVGSLTFGAPLFGQKYAFGGGLAVSQPLIDVGTLGQKHVLLPSGLAIPALALGVAQFSAGRIFVATGFAVQSPTLAAAPFGQKQTLVAFDLAVSPPVPGVGPRPLSTHLLAATSFELSALTITSASILFAYALHADDLVLSGPEFETAPVERVTSPLVWLRNRLKRWSNVKGHPYYDDDHSQNEGPVKEAIFSNHNDEIDLTCSMLTLVGRTSPGEGPAEYIQAVQPLYLHDRKILIDINQLSEELAGLEGAATLPLLSGISTDINLLNDKILAETSARKAAVTAETNARTAADATLDARLTTETNARTAADTALAARVTALETRSYVDLGGVTVITLASGFVYSVLANAGVVIINPATNISSGTFNLPIAPVDRQKIDFIAMKRVNTLTFATANGAHTLANPPTTIMEGKCVTAVFGPALATWLFIS